MTEFQEWLLTEEIRDMVRVPLALENRMKRCVRMVVEALGGRVLNEAVDNFGDPADEETKAKHEENLKKLKTSLQWNRWYAMANRASKVETLKKLKAEYDDYRSQSKDSYDKPARMAMRVMSETMPILEELGYLIEDTVRKNLEVGDEGKDAVWKQFEQQLDKASKEEGNETPIKADRLVVQEVKTNEDTGLREFKFSPTPLAKKETSDFWEILANSDGGRGATTLNSKFNRAARRFEKPMGGSRIGHRIYTGDDLMNEFILELQKSLFSRRSDRAGGVLKKLEPWKWPSAFGKEIDETDVQQIYTHLLSKASGQTKKQLQKQSTAMSPYSALKPETSYNAEQHHVKPDLSKYRNGDKTALDFYKQYLISVNNGTEDSIVASNKGDEIRLRFMQDLVARAGTAKGSQVLSLDPNDIEKTLMSYIKTWPGRRHLPVSYTSQFSRPDDGHDLDVPSFARSDDESESGEDYASSGREFDLAGDSDSEDPESFVAPAARETSLKGQIQQVFTQALQEMAAGRVPGRSPAANGAYYAFILSVKYDLAWEFTGVKKDPEFMEKGGWIRVQNANNIVFLFMQQTARATGQRQKDKGEGGDCIKRLSYWGGKSVTQLHLEVQRLLGINMSEGEFRRNMNIALQILCDKLSVSGLRSYFPED